jgi:hypothetical protein
MSTKLHGVELPAMMEFHDGVIGWEEREVIHTDGDYAWHINPNNNAPMRITIERYRPIPDEHEESEMRLMEPEELAGKWLWFSELKKYQVTAFTGIGVYYTGLWARVDELSSGSCKGWSDEPKSEMYSSFEVEVTE